MLLRGVTPGEWVSLQALEAHHLKHRLCPNADNGDALGVIGTIRTGMELRRLDWWLRECVMA